MIRKILFLASLPMIAAPFVSMGASPAAAAQQLSGTHLSSINNKPVLVADYYGDRDDNRNNDRDRYDNRDNYRDHHDNRDNYRDRNPDYYRSWYNNNYRSYHDGYSYDWYRNHYHGNRDQFYSWYYNRYNRR